MQYGEDIGTNYSSSDSSSEPNHSSDSTGGSVQNSYESS